MPPNQPLHIARFGHHHFSGSQPFIQSQKLPGRIALRRDHGKHRQIAMPDRLQNFVARRRSHFARPRLALVHNTNPATVTITANAKKLFGFNSDS